MVYAIFSLRAVTGCEIRAPGHVSRSFRMFCKMIARFGAAGLLWIAGAFACASANGDELPVLDWRANGGSDAWAQSCATTDRDRCDDEANRCYRNCDTLRCFRSGCLALQHACNIEPTTCAAY